jgi:hypothetical protein
MRRCVNGYHNLIVFLGAGSNPAPKTSKNPVGLLTEDLHGSVFDLLGNLLRG